jgi:hypothetical protein
VATLASLNILSRVARKVAQYNTQLIVPCTDPIVMPVCREVVKEGYTSAGRPDTYNENCKVQKSKLLSLTGFDKATSSILFCVFDCTAKRPKNGVAATFRLRK